MSVSQDPAKDLEAITPSDTVNLNMPSRGVYVGGDGDAACVLANGNVVTLKGLSAGILLPLEVVRINATGTTATYLVSFR